MTDTPAAVALELPGGFHELPIGTTGAERDEAIAALLHDIYPHAAPELRTGLTPLITHATAAMADADLTLAAIGLFSDGPDKVVQCALTLGITPSNHPTPEAAARGTYEILSRTPTTQAQYLDLPHGPAAVGICVSQITYDAAYTTTGHPTPVRMGRLQAYIPFPTGPYLAILTLDTPAMDYWENITVIMATILKTLDFPTPGPATTPGQSA